MANKINIRPVGANILVEPTEVETKTKTGVVLVSKEEERPVSGVIVSLGEGIRLEDGKVVPLSFKVGEKVFFRKYAGNEFEFEGKKYLVISESDILAVEEK